MNKTLFRTNFKFKNQLSKYTGKVRELYKLDNGKLIMISTDKISAFDFILLNYVLCWFGSGFQWCAAMRVTAVCVIEC